MPDTDKVNILVVDDLPEKLLVVESILGELDETIVTARSGEEALRKVLEHEFAVILLDVNMPGMDGLETAAYIRRRRKSAHTPIIFITAFADELHTHQGYSLGAVDYILSPLVPEVLRTKVKVFVDLARMTHQVRRQAEERIALAREQAARAAAEEATKRSTFLAEAGALLSRSLDYETSLRALASLVVPFLADFGAVTRAEDHGNVGRTEIAWSEPGGHIRTHACSHHEWLRGPLGDAVERVLQDGKPEMLSELAGNTSLPPTNGKAEPSKPGLLLQSAVLLPLLARGRCLGVLTLAVGPSGRYYAPADLAVAEDLASRAAVALDNARLYQDIQEGDRRKDEFLAMLAHELRNPLAPMRNAVHVLRLIGLPAQPLIQARDMIDRQVTHMARLIDDLLDMSRLSRGKILLRKETLDLTALVRATVEDYRSMLQESGLGLEWELPSEPMLVSGDPTRLAQIVGNVLHNANKFTDPGGCVRVSLRTAGEGDHAVLCITDTGIGMDPEMLARVFEPFSQADRSLDRSRGGLGLGLALVKGLVELHGGEVHASSDGTGTGTKITIRLPSAREAQRPLEPHPSVQSPTLARRILVIEDNPDTAESMRLLLQMSGHDVEVALAGPDGVESARRFQPEIVLCDIGLPGGMDGYAVARALRQQPSLASAYLIASTGYGQLEDQRRAHEAGFDAHLTKPIDFADLQRLLAAKPQ